MKQIKRSSGLPPNFGNLPDKMKRIIEEEVYQNQLRFSHGYCPGDSRLRTMGADGEALSGFFGDKVKTSVNEEDEAHEDRD
jgi:hypothetical protein